MANIDWIALWWDYGFPVAIILGKSLLLLVALLLIIAFLLLADRKIWAAVMLRRGPNVVGAYRPAAIVRRLHQVRAEGAGHPGGRG